MLKPNLIHHLSSEEVFFVFFRPLPCPFSFKDMEVDPSSFGCIFINSRQLDVMCSKACVRVIKDIRLKNFQEEEQATILSNLLTSNENLQIIYLSRDPRGIYNSMNNTRVFHAEFKSICVSSNRASRIGQSVHTFVHKASFSKFFFKFFSTRWQKFQN